MAGSKNGRFFDISSLRRHLLPANPVITCENLSNRHVFMSMEGFWTR